jgi:phage shock protein E
MKGLIGVAIVAAVATAGDLVWFANDVRHTVTAGVLHGALLLTVVGGVIGAANGRLVRGLPVGTFAGIGAAVCYYLIVAIVGRRAYGAAIPAAWVVMWFLLASWEGRWLRVFEPRSWRTIAWRGLAAAVGSGIAFALVMDVLWGHPPEGGRRYTVQFLAWAFAWAPGLLVLIAGTARRAPHVSSATVAAAAAPSDESSVSPTELIGRIDRGETVHVLDVRSEGEFRAGHVPGAVNVPFSAIAEHAGRLPGSPGEELVVYCGHGPRAYIAAFALRRLGRSRLVFMDGHWAAWERAELREEQGQGEP